MPKKVLVCDDEPSILESISLVVRGEGYAVITAEDGEDALRLARAEMPDLMILDISMPKKDGNRVCQVP
jgi:DNA-binding response OmpR family regulator